LEWNSFATGQWRATDVGIGTVIAIKLDQADPRNYAGLPTALLSRFLPSAILKAMVLRR
jgi:hypothetical protein